MVLSWVIAGLGCVFSGLSYAEMSARVPSAGSSYAYTFYGLGEYAAFLAGFCLFVEVSLVFNWFLCKEERRKCLWRDIETKVNVCNT